MIDQGILNRAEGVKQLDRVDAWDIIIIGGGASGLGTAVDAASRGYKTLLLEQADFAKGTSSRSTKLVHGGVRYLAQGNIGLVYEALHERGILEKNAPHLVKRQSFIIPCYSWFDKVKFYLGLIVYDWLAGKYSFGKSKPLSAAKVKAAIPEINGKGLSGGVEYWDGQFDDARLAINLAQTAAENGGILLNYIKVKGLLKNETDKIEGVITIDTETGIEYQLRAKVVVNATGVFVDEILQMDKPAQKALVRPSQGVHVVLDRSFLQGDKAIMIPKTNDGRVLFAVPWHEHVLIGTTDTLLENHSLEPIALEQEIDFILQTAGLYLKKTPERADVLSIFAGLRPLAAPDKNTNSTKEISRSHKIIVNESGLITIIGGKWTTYRKMAEDIIDKAIQFGALPKKVCITRNLKIHGNTNASIDDRLSVYRSDADLIRSMVAKEPELGERLDYRHPYTKADVIWAVRHEMARTVEDVLARRIRVLFLDATAAINMAPAVAQLMATELGYDIHWQQNQVNDFTQLAKRYLSHA